jgi:transposase
MDMNITIGIDLARRSLRVFAEDSVKRTVLDRNISREKALVFFAQYPKSKIFMEACGGSNWWARKLREQGHEVYLISPQFVKPFARSQKNDRNDAKAILEAGLRPTTRLMNPKESYQQDLQTLHRIRERVVSERKAVVNQIECILLESGIILSRSKSEFNETLLEVLEDGSNDLTHICRGLLKGRYDHMQYLREKEKQLTLQVEEIAQASEGAKKLMKLPGVGPIVATQFLSLVGNGRDFKKGRHVSALLGLVPRQHSSGSRVKLLGITKTGNSEARKTLIQGARCWVMAAQKKGNTSSDPDTQWINGLLDRKAFNVVAISAANKMARRMWATLAYG